MANQERFSFSYPENYKNDRYILNIPILKWRNLIEAVVVDAILKMIITVIPFTSLFDLIVTLSVLIPVSLIFIIGKNGDSITEFIIYYWKFKKNKKTVFLSMPENKNGDSL